MMNAYTIDENMMNEVREARAAGIKALNSLRRAQKQLDSARNWGLFDMLGGGTLTSLIKHSKIDSARQYISAAEYDLQVFQRELSDVRLPNVNIDGFLTFADFFFDGLFADYLVQRRINDARQQLENACSQVEAILRQLPNE